MRRFTPLVLLAGLLAPIAVVSADVPPERPENVCDGHKAGDACGTAGVCRDSTCCHKKHVSATIQHYESRKPRNEQNPDIINPPEICSPCLACEASVPPAPSAPPAAATTPPPAATAPPPAASGETPPASAPAPAPAPRGMCTVAAGAGGHEATGLLLGALLGLTFARRLRR